MFVYIFLFFLPNLCISVYMYLFYLLQYYLQNGLVGSYVCYYKQFHFSNRKKPFSGKSSNFFFFLLFLLAFFFVFRLFQGSQNHDRSGENYVKMHGLSSSYTHSRRFGKFNHFYDTVWKYTEICSHTFLTKFRESNVFTKLTAKVLI